MINSAAEFVALRTSQQPEEYLRAAQEPASAEVWLEVIGKHPDMRKWVAHNKSVPLYILELLAGDDDPRVRWHVATKRKLSPALFSKLGSDSDPSVRTRIAHNPKAPISILEQLTSDQNAEVALAAKQRIASRLQKTQPDL